MPSNTHMHAVCSQIQPGHVARVHLWKKAAIKVVGQDRVSNRVAVVPRKFNLSIIVFFSPEETIEKVLEALLVSSVHFWAFEHFDSLKDMGLGWCLKKARDQQKAGHVTYRRFKMHFIWYLWELQVGSFGVKCSLYSLGWHNSSGQFYTKAVK